MTRKKDSNMKLHSKQTGALILIALVTVMIGGGIWLYLVFDEANNINDYENRFRSLPCEDMKKEFESILPRHEWQRMALMDKDC